MNTRHVPDLELCQEFDTLCKEKGIVVPETEFYWFKLLRGTWTLQDMYWCDASYVLRIPAPLVSEQGEWLPRYIQNIVEAVCETQPIGEWELITRPTCNNGGGLRQFEVRYIYKMRAMRQEEQKQVAPAPYDIAMVADTEANARIKCLNNLIAEGIITNL